jgi:hypothetical protein
MTNGAVAAAAIANAIKASGAIIRVENRDFQSIIQRSQKPLVVVSGKSFWSPSYKYLSSYKGLAFYTKSSQPLNLPGDSEIISCNQIYIPS